MVLYRSFVTPYYMKWLRNIQIIRIIRIIFRYSNIRIMIFKLWILFVIRFGHFLPTNIIRLFDSLQNDYSWQHWCHLISKMFTLLIIIANIFADFYCFCSWSFDSFEDLQHIDLTIFASFCFTQYHIEICTENIQ